MKRDARGASLGAAGWALLGLLLARAVVAFAPSMWAWGLNLQRFLAPIPAWLPWIAAVATLHPRIAARLGPGLDRAGDAMLRRRWAVGLAAAVVVGCLPDRTWMTGDFLIREAATASGGQIISFTEALPLEVLLFKELPRSVAGLAGADPNVAMRVFGALGAGALAVSAVALAGVWGLAGRAALVAAAASFLGGHLCTLTGLAKPAGLVCLLTAVALIAATRLAREGRGGALLGVAVGLALFAHRSAVTLIPLWAVAVALAFRRRARGEPVGRGAWLALALPPAAALAVAPAVREIVARYDLPNHLAPADLAAGGIVGAAFAPLHLADLANLLVFFSPLLPVAAGVALATGPRAPRTVEARLALLLALTFVPVLLFVHPRQGIFRDLEVFAPAGVAFVLLAGLVLGRAIATRRLADAVAPALVATAAMHALQCLTLFNDPAAGFERTRAFAMEAPARPARELAQVWDFMAYRAFKLGDWPRAVEACTQSVRYGPHPRALAMLAIARTYTGDHRGAESLYVALSERTPDDPLVWVGLGGSALRVGDSVQVARARARLDAYPVNGREARLIRRHLSVFPEVWPGVGSGRGGAEDGTRR
jgi:hypothetical protein